MLDVDYNHNRIVVCGYQAHILKTVGNMISKKQIPGDKSKIRILGTNRRSIEKMQAVNSRASPVKANTQNVGGYPSASN